MHTETHHQGKADERGLVGLLGTLLLQLSTARFIHGGIYQTRPAAGQAIVFVPAVALVDIFSMKLFAGTSFEYCGDVLVPC